MENLETIDGIREELLHLQDKKYRDFTSRLIPTLEKEKIIGVRMPDLRNLSKRIDANFFLNNIPHKYQEENLLHAILLSEEKDYKILIKRLNEFLPMVNNWSVCDTISPKIKASQKQKFLEDIKFWISSDHLYTSRFGMRMLMVHFLKEDFKKEYFNLILERESDEYYLRMMRAWFFAEALVHQWEESILILKEEKLDLKTHNLTIQKARESQRFTTEQKEFLKSLKK